MKGWLQGQFRQAYERLLLHEITDGPKHIAVIQDGNRRYAQKQGEDPKYGHEEGVETTEQLLQWCANLDIRELTLYAFSTENFNRPPEERQHLFNLIEEKLYEFADKDRIHNEEVHIQVIGETSRLPTDVQDAITYAEQQTHDYDRFRLNIAIAYGGREELLSTARDIAIEVKDGNINPSDIDVNTFAKRIHDGPVRDVDLIIRTGGDERTSNFLPWHANGNEAAVFFCTPYWPEFSKIDFLRGIRTYESREESWRQAKVQRALALLRAFGGVELEEAKRILTRFKDSVPDHEPDVVSSDQRPNRR